MGCKKPEKLPPSEDHASNRRQIRTSNLFGAITALGRATAVVPGPQDLATAQLIQLASALAPSTGFTMKDATSPPHDSR